MSKPLAAKERQIKSYDPVWSQVRREAEEISAASPLSAASSMPRFWTTTDLRMPYATDLRGGSSTRRWTPASCTNCSTR